MLRRANLRHPLFKRKNMLDLAALAALLVFFGLGALFVRGCDLI
jgi:hypothetical protein